MKSIITSILARIQRVLLAATVLGAISGSGYGAVVNVGSGPWVWQRTLPQGNGLNGVSCPSIDVCYAVGNLGTILKGTSGWTSWSAQISPTGQNLNAISCPDVNTCFAVGDGGIILATTTGGTTWTFQTSPTTVSLLGISCPSATACVAVGGETILAYQTFCFPHEGCFSSWTVQKDPTVTYTSIGVTAGVFLNGVSCPSLTTCFAAGASGNVAEDPVVAVSHNGGISWQAALLSIPPSGLFAKNPLQSISCATTSLCLAGGTLAGFNPKTGVFSIGEQSWITTDGGTTWARGTVAAGGGGVSCLAGLFSYYFAATQTSPSSGFETFNSGSSWTTVFSGGTYSLNAISCQLLPEGGFNSVPMCMAVGDRGEMVTNAPLAAAWINQSTAVTTQRLARSSCPTVSNCYAVGDGGTIVATSDGGATWNAQSSNSTQNLTDISCASAAACLAVGANGAILELSNGSWAPVAGLPPANWSGVSCPNSNSCFFAGNLNGSGVIISNIAAPPFTFPDKLTGISCTTTTSCVASAAGGYILTLANGFWNITNLTSNDLLGVSCGVTGSTTQFCVVVGAGGTVFRTVNGSSWSNQSTISRTLSGVSCFTSKCAITTLEGYVGFTDVIQTPMVVEFEGQIEGIDVDRSPSLGLQANPVNTSALNGAGCSGTSVTSLCVAVGTSGTIIARPTIILGTGDLTPRGGNSEVGDVVKFSLTWTVTGGKSWRDLEHLDLKLADNAGIGLWARFYPGNPSTFALLDSNGNVVGVGVPGSASTVESSTASLDLAKSSFDAAGPTSPTVTVNFVVTFRPAAARDASATAARVYDTEISATDVTGASQGPEQVGHWVVQP